MKFKQIAIIGVGLIGGSIGLAARQKKLAKTITGVTAHQKTLNKAKKRKAIDAGFLNAREAVKGSDMVILALPVDRILPTLRKIRPSLKKGCVVTDVGSVKGTIVGPAEKILGKNGNFVGAHPMAGSEQRGIEKADSDLFKGMPCILTRTGGTDKKALRLVARFWEALGSRVSMMSPSEHDKHVSNISHLPHVAASALALEAMEPSLIFASTGFQDTTRIASGDPDLWAAILTDNSASASADIKKYSKLLAKIGKLIETRDKAKLKRILRKAKEKRDTLGSG